MKPSDFKKLCCGFDVIMHDGGNQLSWSKIGPYSSTAGCYFKWSEVQEVTPPTAPDKPWNIRISTKTAGVIWFDLMIMRRVPVTVHNIEDVPAPHLMSLEQIEGELRKLEDELNRRVAALAPWDDSELEDHEADHPILVYTGGDEPRNETILGKDENGFIVDHPMRQRIRLSSLTSTTSSLIELLKTRSNAEH